MLANRSAIAGIVLSTTIALIADQAAAQSAACLPTCDPADAKLFNLSGTGLEKLSSDRLELSIIVNPGVDAFTFGIFDGDTGGFWDDGSLPMEYTLFEDPYFDGSGMAEVSTYSGADMADNAWTEIDVGVADSARDPGGSGYAFYRLVVANPDPLAAGVSNSFKVRTSDVSRAWLIVQPQPFAVEPVFSSVELLTIFPDFPDLSTRTYDGSMTFFLDVPETVSVDPLTDAEGTFFAVWDSDLDHGAIDCSLAYDSNDANTPDDILPPWATSDSVRYEGVATSTVPCTAGTNGPNGETFTSGDPPDDVSVGAIENSPSVVYSVHAPDGQVFLNDNPSGNLEWEQFRIGAGTEPVPTVADANGVGGLALGTWRLVVEGLDLSNHSSFRFLNDYLCVTEQGTACPAAPVIEEPPAPDDCGCEGKVAGLELIYTGDDEFADVYVTAKHDRKLIHSEMLSPGEVIAFDGEGKHIDNKETLGTEINLYVNGVINARIHTSCSLPIGTGMQFGDFLVSAGHSRNGGELCALPGETQDTKLDKKKGKKHGSSDKSRHAPLSCKPGQSRAHMRSHGNRSRH